MKLILHLGFGKTGTSALQYTLHKHSEELSEYGVIYPSIPSHKSSNHNVLLCAFKSPDKWPRQFRRPKRLASYEAVANSLFREIDRATASGGHSAVVLSGEYLPALTGEEMEAFKARLAHRFSEVTAVQYVREPSAYYLSAIQQGIKASAKFAAPTHFDARIRQQIEHIAQHFPSHVVRKYDRGLFPNGNIVEDFLTAMLPGPAAEASAKWPPEHINESLPAESMCIMQQFRKVNWPDGNGVFTPEGNVLMSTLRGIEGQARPTLRPGLAGLIYDRHAEDLLWLNDRFGISFERPADEGAPPPSRKRRGLSSILDVDGEAISRVLYTTLARLATR